MIVGLCRAEIYFPDSHSLKDKRHVLHSIKDRLKKLNVSVAEVGELICGSARRSRWPVWRMKAATSSRC